MSFCSGYNTIIVPFVILGVFFARQAEEPWYSLTTPYPLVNQGGDLYGVLPELYIIAGHLPIGYFNRSQLSTGPAIFLNRGCIRIFFSNRKERYLW